MSDHGEVAEEWQVGDLIEVEPPDGQRVRCRVVTVTEDGYQVVPEARRRRTVTGGGQRPTQRHNFVVRLCDSGLGGHAVAARGTS